MKDTLLCEEAGNDAATVHRHHSPPQHIPSHKSEGLKKEAETRGNCQKKERVPGQNICATPFCSKPWAQVYTGPILNVNIC